MLTSTVVDLRRMPSWDPRQLTAEAFSWPTSEPLVPVRGLATRVAAQSFADAGAPVVLPQGIDQSRGGIRKRANTYQGPVFQVGRELREGDVLIPRAEAGPALYISRKRQGSLFAGKFLALRPLNERTALWLWAVLSSQTGQRWRGSLSRGSISPILDALTLLDSALPLPSEADLRGLADRLQAEERTTHIDEEEPAQTWWRAVDLRDHGWHLSLATPEPEILHAGTPLSAWSADIRPGRNMNAVAVEGEVPGYLPVADISTLSGRPPRRWAPADGDNSVIAEPGDLLVAALGNAAHASIAETPAAIDAKVFRVRLATPEVGPWIARYLNSQAGYHARQVLLTGSALPHLRLDDLARLPIPEGELRAQSPEPLQPLATRLEDLLWSR
ncbi:hypothetical protein BKA08_001292 [Nocardioides marinisabuli]|uniref:Restriction endonuclease subunit S n=1 Tax=Nocardioides marinisabuli TaxID=419476 RepID=A0A7Y9JRT0_9ACTN|nr:hypothetical protein [Nocardioides marinisabuli]NYD57054.1 hypothetical protein [Nocardioides marinisabuli]